MVGTGPSPVNAVCATKARCSSSVVGAKTRWNSLTGEAWKKRIGWPLSTISWTLGSVASQCRSSSDSVSRTHWPCSHGCTVSRDEGVPVAPDSRDGALPRHPDALRPPRALADEVAEVDDVLNAAAGDVGKHGLVRRDVPVDVGDDSDSVAVACGDGHQPSVL